MAELSPESFSRCFLLIFQFPETYRKIIVCDFCQKHLPEFYNFPKFSENFETIFVNILFQFCLSAEFIRRDGAILADDQPIGRFGITNLLTPILPLHF